MAQGIQNADRELWTAVDHYTFSHSHPPSSRSTPALQHALVSSKEAGLPDIAASPSQAKFLALFCRAVGVTHLLELGTLGGYTSIFLASENPQLHITTVEVSPKNADVARSNIEFAGLSDRVEVILGPALEVVGRLRQEVLAGERPQFGFVFADADKENNWNYFNLAADITKPKGVICVDNVVRGGRIVNSATTDPRILGGREVIEKAGKDPRVDTVVIQTVGEKGFDGWLWAVLH